MIFSGTHNILKVRDSGWHGGNRVLQRGGKVVHAIIITYQKSFFSLFFYWSRTADFKLGINFKSGFKRPCIKK